MASSAPSKMKNFSEKANFIWSITDLIRDTFYINPW